MKYRRLGNAGVKLSEIGLGGWLTFGKTTGEATGRALIETAFARGINFYDTANVYAQGACETMWGDLLKPYPRSSFVLASKVYFPMGDGPNDRGLSRKHIMEQCEASLKRLGTDYIDLYQCHRYDDETPLEETLRAMDDLVRQAQQGDAQDGQPRSDGRPRAVRSGAEGEVRAHRRHRRGRRPQRSGPAPRHSSPWPGPR